MHQCSLLWIPAFFLLGLTACSSPEGGAPDEVPSTELNGTLEDMKAGEVEVHDRIAPFTYRDTVLDRDSLKDGSFSLRFRKASLGYLVFSDSSREELLFLRPGDSLVLRRDLQGKLHFKGEGASRNRYLRERASFRDSIGRVQGNIFHLKKEAFLKALKERREAFNSFRSSYFRSNRSGLDSSFKELERLRDLIDLALIRTSYPVIYQHENPLDSISFSEDYWGFLDSMDLSDPRLLEVPQFLNFAYSLANKYTFENKGKQRSMAYRQMLYETIIGEFEGRVRDVVLTYFILEQIRYSKKGVQGELIERYRKEVNDPSMRDFVNDKLKARREERGSPS